MRTILLLIFLFSVPSFGTNRVLSYEPSKVDLSGTLDVQTFPGPPNYESIENGDEIERHFYLKLDSPVDVVPSAMLDKRTILNLDKERNVSIVMLSISAEDDALWARFRQIGKGRRVKISGTLFHRFNGHHHSRVLMHVEIMEPLKPR